VEVILKAKAVMFLNYFMIYHRCNIPNSLVGQRAKYFSCHFESYNIIKNKCIGVPQKERFIILERELQDMFAWYRKFQRDHVMEKEIHEQMKEFIDNLDISVFAENLHKCRWYKDYLKIKENKSATSTSTIKNNKSSFYANVRKLTQCLEDNGLIYTLKLVKNKLLQRI